jgi:hypothetical protein
MSGVSPATARVNDRIEASTTSDVVVQDRVVVPSGSLIRGVVVKVKPATQEIIKGALSVRFDYLTVNDHGHAIKAAAVRDIERALPAGAVLQVRFD